MNYHKTSWSGLFDIVKDRNYFSKWYFLVSFVISLIGSSFIGIYYFENIYHVLLKLSDLTISVYPNLLGFSLGGYAIVVGFNNSNLLKFQSVDEGFSYYQKMSAVFAVVILVQTISIILAFTINFLYDVRQESGLVNLDNTFFCICALVGLLILSFTVLYSLMLTPVIVINLFSLSQIVDLMHLIEKRKEEKGNSSNQK